MAGKAAWKQVVATEDQVTGMAYMNDALYLNTHKGASRFLVRKLDLEAPEEFNRAIEDSSLPRSKHGGKGTWLYVFAGASGRCRQAT